jgi:2-dehydro-3-deoxygluconokinase
VDLSSKGPLHAYGVRQAVRRIERLAPGVLFANRDEAAALLHTGGRRAWPGLLAQAPLVVVKDGAWGCRVLWREDGQGAVRQVDVAAQRVRAVDTTGAGDAFAAGFLAALVRAGGLTSGLRDPVLRRAALSGHRLAAAFLGGDRPELDPW